MLLAMRECIAADAMNSLKMRKALNAVFNKEEYVSPIIKSA